MAGFVKAHDTKVSVEKSQQDIIALLRRYGARDFGFDEDPESDVATVRFRVKGSGGLLPVELRVHVTNVYTTLYGDSDATMRGAVPRDPVATRQRWQEQARRTAWRNLVDWLDAALSTTSIGIQTVEEVFLAHVVLPTVDGRQGRVIDYIQQAMIGRGGLPALPSGKD